MWSAVRCEIEQEQSVWITNYAGVEETKVGLGYLEPNEPPSPSSQANKRDIWIELRRVPQ